jgi:hypothetical protein
MYSGPKITENGLVFGFDASGTSFRFNKGKPTTNILTTISKAGVQNDTYFKTNSGTEEINVPKVGLRTVHYVNIYNDYNGGSGNCCPSPMYFGDISISPSTEYTYQIVYRTTDGYANANYMYHYEYNSGTYVTEYGLHSFGREEDLGEGWKHGWGTFTSNASANRFLTYLFHYQYAIWNKIQVAAIGITQGNSVLRPHQIPNINTTRSATNSLIDAIKVSSIDVSNISFNSTGLPIFDGTNDSILVASNSSNNVTGDITIECVAKRNSGQGVLVHKEVQYTLLIYSDGSVTYADSSLWSYSSFGAHGSAFTSGVYHHIVVTKTGGIVSIYIDNNLIISKSFGSSISSTSNQLCVGSYNNSLNYFNGEIPVTRIYNRALSATEISSNFKAYQKRFNI